MDAVVVGVRPGADGGDPAVAGPTSALGDLAGELPGLVALLGGTGKAEEVTRVPTRGTIGAPLVVAVGLGAEPGDAGGAGETPDLAEQVRRAAGAAARTLHGHAAHVVTTLSALDLTAAIEGTLLGDYAFTDYKKAPETAPTELTRVGLVGDGDEAAVTRAAAVVRAVRHARDFVNTPPNDLYPDAFAQRARSLAEAAGVSVEILDESALAEHGYGGVLGVGGGSSRPPRLVRLDLLAGESAEEGRPRRQGHHVRHRRHLDQARGEHGPHDLGHVRGRRASSPPPAWPPTSGSTSRSSPPCRWPRTCPRAPRTAPATS